MSHLHLVTGSDRCSARPAADQARLRARLRLEYLHVPTSVVAEREGVEPRIVDRLRRQGPPDGGRAA